MFRLVLSVVTGGVAGLWVIHDVVLLARLRAADRGDPLVADQRFGYVMGIVIGMIGVVGTLRFIGVA
ncbi:MAG TPA: hypothetical protein VFK02_18335 [Kofleriaceae bacterium]|nr:hypothetical protein [Kofleriaceae bacterium]